MPLTSQISKETINKSARHQHRQEHSRYNCTTTPSFTLLTNGLLWLCGCSGWLRANNSLSWTRSGFDSQRKGLATKKEAHTNAVSQTGSVGRQTKQILYPRLISIKLLWYYLQNGIICQRKPAYTYYFSNIASCKRQRQYRSNICQHRPSLVRWDSKQQRNPLWCSRGKRVTRAILSRMPAFALQQDI